MKQSFLTSSNLIVGKLINLFKFLLQIKTKPDDKNINGYIAVGKTSTKMTRNSGSVGIYKNSNGEKFLIKSHSYHFKDLDYIYLQNEASILSLLKLNRKTRTNVEISHLVEINDNGKTLSLILKYAEGKPIANLTEDKKIEILKTCLKELPKIYDRLSKSSKKIIPQRGFASYGFSILIYLAIAALKDLSKTLDYLVLISKFFINYSLSLNIKQKPVLSHRELSSGNILFNQKTKTITIVDWENAIITDKLYDLSQVLRLYFNEINREKLINLVNELITCKADEKRLLALCIYNGLQSIALNPKNSSNYKLAENYLNTFIKNPTNRSEVISEKNFKSPFEFINSLSLSSIYWINKALPLIKANNKNIVLCYHSISNSGWRFSTSVRDFEEQIKYLKSNFNIITLDEMINSNKKGVVISFDDGYKDVYTNALPILRKYKIKPIIFSIGNLKNPDREELDNNLEMMDIRQIKQLKKMGWEIGFHTMTHANLAKSPIKKLREEIITGKKMFEKKLGFGIKYFAYPKGIYSSGVIELIKQAGFSAAFSVDGSPASLKNKMLIDRIPTEGELNVRQFSALVSPLGLIVTHVFMYILQKKERITITVYKLKDILGYITKRERVLAINKA